MRYITLFIMFFFLNSCSLNNMFLSQEVDKVTVVKYKPYVKHHRAYFTRTHLKVIQGKQNYYFLYHPKKQHVAVLLHKKNTYELHNFTKPDTPVLRYNGKKSFKRALKYYKHQGYVRKNLKALGFEPKLALRKYKGVKTLLIDMYDYRALQKVYKQGIRTYNARKIVSIKTVLPKHLIYGYYESYRKRAKTKQQLQQLHRIATKAGFSSNIPRSKLAPVSKKVKPVPVKKSPVTTPEEEKVEPVIKEIEPPKKETPKPKVAEKIYTAPKQVVKGYKYYRYHASMKELERYLAKPSTRSTLSYTHYQKLKKHLNKLREEKLLSDGSLEELIAAYKVNKNPKFKQRILLLMKEKQAKK